MIALHLVLVLDRLAGAGEPGRRLGEALTEAFVADLDDTLREMTVGDLAVPRHVKRAVAALHERYAAYRAALAAADDAPLTRSDQCPACRRWRPSRAWMPRQICAIHEAG